jgi:26S proteasome regulatory subunit N2
LAIVSFGQEENADGVIESLLSDKDFILRYGGAFTIGLAYAGTSNNNAIRKLLHYAVEDVADDVRRAAVIALGFVMFN